MNSIDKGSVCEAAMAVPRALAGSRRVRTTYIGDLIHLDFGRATEAPLPSYFIAAVTAPHHRGDSGANLAPLDQPPDRRHELVGAVGLHLSLGRQDA